MFQQIIYCVNGNGGEVLAGFTKKTNQTKTTIKENKQTKKPSPFLRWLKKQKMHS